MKFLNHTFFSALAVLSLLLSSCRSGNTHVIGDGDTIPMSYAVNLSMTDHEGYTRVDIRNPWDTTKTLHTYLLVPSSVDKLPDNLPTGTVVRIPIKKSIVYSSVHNSLISELGATEAISGICDVQYIHQPILTERIKTGAIADCGNSMAPDLEEIIRVNPGAILLSPFENSNGYGKLSQLGIPIIECADYMETSPLGRAEWMKFYGRLFGKSELADSLFQATEHEYNEVKERVASSNLRPKVLIDRIYGQSWNVPGAYSTMGRFIEDAGGKNIFDDYKLSGSTPLAPEQVLFKGNNADIWLLRYAGNKDMTLSQLAKDNTIYRNFAPFKNGQVYGCNTSRIYFYEDVPFHPQWLLADMARLIHPEISQPDSERHYFTRLDEK